MPTPGEHKTVQARLLEYPEDIDWTIVPREETEQHRSFDSEAVPGNRMKGASLFLDGSVLGSMNDLAFHYKFSIQEAGGVHSPAVPEIIRRLNRMPMGALKYVFPIEALKALYQTEER